MCSPIRLLFEFVLGIFSNPIALLFALVVIHAVVIAAVVSKSFRQRLQPVGTYTVGYFTGTWSLGGHIGLWLYRQREAVLAALICAVFWVIVLTILFTPWIAGWSPAGLIGMAVLIVLYYGGPILVIAIIVIGDFIALAAWKPILGTGRRDAIRRGLKAICWGLIACFPASWRLSLHLAGGAFAHAASVLGFVISLVIWTVTYFVLVTAWIPVPRVGFFAPFGLVRMAFTWMVDNPRPTLAVALIISIALLLTLTIFLLIFRSGPRAVRIRTRMRRWPAKVGWALIVYFPWSWRTGQKLSARIVGYWSTPAPGTTPPAPTTGQTRWLTVLAASFCFWGPTLLVLLYPWVPVNLDKPGATTAAKSSIGLPPSSSGTGPTAPTPTPPVVKVEPPPVVKVEPPPKPPQGMKLAKEIALRLREAEQKQKAWGIEYKIPPDYSKEDVDEALAILNDVDRAMKEKLPVGYVVERSKRFVGWVRMAPSGPALRPIVDIEK